MPIRRYVESGVFTSEALSVMGKAFEAAVWTLGDCDEMKREAVARFIIQLARDDGGLDVTTLHRRAIAAFGEPVVAELVSDTGHGLSPPSAGGAARRPGR